MFMVPIAAGGMAEYGIGTATTDMSIKSGIAIAVRAIAVVRLRYTTAPIIDGTITGDTIAGPGFIYVSAR